MAQVWCSQCPEPAVVEIRGEGYCPVHDPRKVQVQMSLGEAEQLARWLAAEVHPLPPVALGLMGALTDLLASGILTREEAPMA